MSESWQELASVSLLSTRRPSWAPPPFDDPIAIGSYRDVPALHFTATRPEPSTSPDDGGNFGRSLQIDMKDLVGDAVGNVRRRTLPGACLTRATDEHQPNQS